MNETFEHLQKMAFVILAGYSVIATTISIMQAISLKKHNGFNKRLDALHGKLDEMRGNMTMKENCLDHARIIDEKIKLAILEHKDSCRNRRSSDERPNI